MTDDSIFNDQSGGDAPQEGVGEMLVEERRGASLVLREDDARESRAASMEAANQALAGALRVMYRLLQVTMVALLVLFVATGHQSVQENQRGVKVRLGEVIATDLAPGSHLSLPRPFGEVIAVDTRPVTLDLEDAFFPRLSEQDKMRPFEQVNYAATLDPARDGALFTADRSLTHARWAVRYFRADPEQYLRSIHPEDEEMLVRRAVERAAVRVVAGVTLDELQRADERQAVFEQVRLSAQATLDVIGTGLTIIDVTAQQFYPPTNVLKTFTQSNLAVSEAEIAKEKAQAEANVSLISTAGGAARPLLTLIEAYEKAIDEGDDARAESVLQTIFNVLDGAYVDEGLTFDGQDLGSITLGGDVATRLSAARAYRQKVANEARSRAEVFSAKLPSYMRNPQLFMASERARAMSELARKSLLKVFMVPGSFENFSILINDDPELMRDIEAKERAERRRRAVEERERLIEGLR